MRAACKKAERRDGAKRSERRPERSGNAFRAKRFGVRGPGRAFAECTIRANGSFFPAAPFRKSSVKPDQSKAGCAREMGWTIAFCAKRFCFRSSQDLDAGILV